MILGQIDDSWTRATIEKIEKDSGKFHEPLGPTGQAVMLILVMVVLALGAALSVWLLFVAWRVWTAPLRIAKSLEEMSRRSR